MDIDMDIHDHDEDAYAAGMTATHQSDGVSSLRLAHEVVEALAA